MTKPGVPLKDDPPCMEDFVTFDQASEIYHIHLISYI